MAAVEGLLIGGPLDGATVPGKTHHGWLWVAAANNSRGNLSYVEPGLGRVLYRSLGVKADVERWLFAGHTHARCATCGGYTAVAGGTPTYDWAAMRSAPRPRPRCEGCGALIERSSDRIAR